MSLHLIFPSQGVFKTIVHSTGRNGEIALSSPCTLTDLTTRPRVMGKPHRQGNYCCYMYFSSLTVSEDSRWFLWYTYCLPPTGIDS